MHWQCLPCLQCTGFSLSVLTPIIALSPTNALSLRGRYLVEMPVEQWLSYRTETIWVAKSCQTWEGLPVWVNQSSRLKLKPLVVPIALLVNRIGHGGQQLIQQPILYVRDLFIYSLLCKCVRGSTTHRWLAPGVGGKRWVKSLIS